MNHIKDQIRCGAAYRLGLTGKGIGVAVLDTGIFLHRDFDSRVTGFADMVNGKTFAYDDCGHGMPGLLLWWRRETMVPGT